MASTTSRDHALGVALIVIVALLWVGSSQLIQSILGSGGDFNKPFFLTYFTTTMFSVMLAGFSRRSWRAELYAPSGRDAKSNTRENSKHPTKYNARDVAQVAMMVGPPYVVANYLFALGLSRTTASSSSAISQLSSLFLLAMSAYSGVAKFSWPKLGASIITIAGAAIISRADGKHGYFVGDVLTLFGAMVFGIYTSVLEANAPKGKVNVGMMWGLIGLFNACFLWVPLPILSMTGVEPFSLPSRHALVLLVLNALCGSVLSEYVWTKGLQYSSGLISTIGLSLTVPISLVVDTVTGKIKITLSYVVGVLLVLSGFVIVNVAHAIEKAKEEEAKNKSPEESQADDDVIPLMDSEQTHEEED